MKVVKKLILMLLLSAIFFSTTMTCMAASASTYKNYVKKQMVPSLGKAAEGTKKSQDSMSNLGGWCKTKGVLSVYTDDLDSNKGKEALVVYLKDSDSYYGGVQKKLHLAVLKEKKGKIVVNQDIAISNNVDSGIKSDTSVYVKTYKKKKYVVIQQFSGIDGCSCETYVLAMNTSGKLAVKKAVFDPGYTSGIGLYRIPLSGVRNELSTDGYYDRGVALYETETDYDVSASKIYGKKLQSELNKFGLKVSVGKTYFNASTWIMQKNSDMKLICSIKAKGVYGSDKFIYTYVLTDKTKF